MTKKIGKIKLVLSLVLAFVMAFGLIAPINVVKAEAIEKLQALTLKEEDFTLIGTPNCKETFKVYGLTNDYKRVDLTAEQAKHVKVESENTDVATVAGRLNAYNEITVNFKKVGEAVINYTYDDPAAKIGSVTSNVVVESDTMARPAKNVRVIVEFNIEGFEKLKDTVDVSPSSNLGKDTLKYSPTALGALKQAFPDKVKVNNGFVLSISGVKGEMIDGVWHGWQYKVNGKKPLKGAGIYKIKDRDKVEWTYEKVSF